MATPIADTTAVTTVESDLADAARCASCKKDAEGKRCNRTPEQWHQLLFFYLCFYSSLIAFFAICYSVMYETLPDRQSEPVFQNLIKNTLVEYPFEPDYNAADAAQVADLFAEVNDMLVRSNQANADFGACTSASLYQLGTATPCLLFRLNRKFGFKLPQDAPLTCTPGARAPAGLTIATQGGSDFQSAAFPFLNGAAGQPTSPYQDSIVAVQLNGLAANTEYDFEINCQASWGQALGDSACGYREARVRIVTPP
jgi:hypothetical protein